MCTWSTGGAAASARRRPCEGSTSQSPSEVTMSLGTVMRAMRLDGAGLGCEEVACGDARDPEGLPQAHLPHGVALPELGAERENVGRGRDHRQGAAGQKRVLRQLFGQDRAAHRKTDRRKSGVGLPVAREIVRDGPYVPALGGAERVSAGRVAVPSKVEGRHVVAAGERDGSRERGSPGRGAPARSRARESRARTRGGTSACRRS